ncbi:hypothetical protein BDN70DRAFT_988172, partial [Pholiota conissans]
MISSVCRRIPLSATARTANTPQPTQAVGARLISATIWRRSWAIALPHRCLRGDIIIRMGVMGVIMGMRGRMGMGVVGRGVGRRGTERIRIISLIFRRLLGIIIFWLMEAEEGIISSSSIINTNTSITSIRARSRRAWRLIMRRCTILTRRCRRLIRACGMSRMGRRRGVRGGLCRRLEAVMGGGMGVRGILGCRGIRLVRRIRSRLARGITPPTPPTTTTTTTDMGIRTLIRTRTTTTTVTRCTPPSPHRPRSPQAWPPRTSPPRARARDHARPHPRVRLVRMAARRARRGHGGR